MPDAPDVHAWDLVIGPHNRRQAEAAIAGEDPRWHQASRTLDWRNYVPVEARKRWGTLTEAERAKAVGDAVLAVMDREYVGF